MKLVKFVCPQKILARVKYFVLQKFFGMLGGSVSIEIFSRIVLSIADIFHDCRR